MSGKKGKCAIVHLVQKQNNALTCIICNQNYTKILMHVFKANAKILQHELLNATVNHY